MLQETAKKTGSQTIFFFQSTELETVPLPTRVVELGGLTQVMTHQ